VLAGLIFAGVTGVTAACGSSSGQAPDAAQAPDGATPDSALPDGSTPADATPDSSTPADAAPDAAPPNACASPVTVTPDPTAEAAATAALQALAPLATLKWNASLGALSGISPELSFTLPDCTGDKDVNEELFKILEQSPALFQIDRTEWSSNPLSCATVLDQRFLNIVIHRIRYGAYTYTVDVFAVGGYNVNGVVVLRNFSSTHYLPRPSADVLAKLAACTDKSEAELTAPLRAKAFNYVKYALPPANGCMEDGRDVYTAAESDTLTFDPTIQLSINEDSGVTFRRQQTATLLVVPENYTPALENSDANCVDLDGVSHVGWIRTFDTVTGEILYDRDNPDPTCVVCLK
jgi:hypothetical protein